MNKKFSARGSGFTLLEILVVLSISSLLFLGGYTSYRDFSRRQQLEGVAKELKSNIELAKQKVLSGEKLTASFCSGGNLSLSGHELSLGSASYGFRAKCSDGTYSSYYNQVALNGFSITVVPTTQTTVLFKVLGGGTTLSANLVITLHQDSTDNTRTVTITPQGVVQ